MVLERQAVCRIVIKDTSGKTQLWSGTIYKDVVFGTPEQVINRIKEIFG